MVHFVPCIELWCGVPHDNKKAKVMKESVPKGGDGGAPALSMGKDSVVFGDDDVRAVVGIAREKVSTNFILVVNTFFPRQTK